MEDRLTKPIVLAVDSDVHNGSTLAACPPEGVRLDDGGKYTPSLAQLWLWQCWEDYWLGHVQPLVHKLKAELWVVLNGDSFEGDHHGTSQIVSRNPEPQAYLADRVFGVPRSLKPKRTFIVRGTEAHVGPSGATEEGFARSIRAERDPVSQKWSWWHLRLRPHGVLWDFQHHPSSRGTLPWTRPQMVSRMAFRIWTEHQLRKREAPQVAIRSHQHVHADSEGQYPTRAVITPAWQLKTAHAHKVAADSIADVGGLLVAVYPDGEMDWQQNQKRAQAILYEPEEATIWSE